MIIVLKNHSMASYYSQVKPAKAVEQIFHSDKESSRRLAGGKSRGFDAVRVERMPTESLD